MVKLKKIQPLLFFGLLFIPFLTNTNSSKPAPVILMAIQAYKENQTSSNLKQLLNLIETAPKNSNNPASVNYQYENALGSVPLIQAINGLLPDSVIEALIKQGANVNYTGRFKETPLSAALNRKDYFRITHLLQKNGAMSQKERDVKDEDQARMAEKERRAEKAKQERIAEKEHAKANAEKRRAIEKAAKEETAKRAKQERAAKRSAEELKLEQKNKAEKAQRAEDKKNEQEARAIEKEEKKIAEDKIRAANKAEKAKRKEKAKQAKKARKIEKRKKAQAEKAKRAQPEKTKRKRKRQS
jgi:hypothetical protein